MKEKPYFIKEPFGIPYELTETDTFRRLNTDSETKFCKLVDEMIIDEEKAAIDYEKLKLDKEHHILNAVIEGIRLDESKHAKLLKIIKSVKCKE